MTCIVGLIDNGTVYIGADSQGTMGYVKYNNTASTSKVFRNGPLLIAGSGSQRALNLLRYAFDPPAHHPSDMDAFAFMTVNVVNAIRDCFRDAGATKCEDNIEGNDDSAFLVGYQGRLFLISSDWSVYETCERYIAAGSGQEIALGAMFASTETNPTKRITKALEAAERFDTGCRGPFTVEELT